MFVHHGRAGPLGFRYHKLCSLYVRYLSSEKLYVSYLGLLVIVKGARRLRLTEHVSLGGRVWKIHVRSGSGHAANGEKLLNDSLGRQPNGAAQ